MVEAIGYRPLNLERQKDQAKMKKLARRIPVKVNTRTGTAPPDVTSTLLSNIHEELKLAF